MGIQTYKTWWESLGSLELWQNCSKNPLTVLAASVSLVILLSYFSTAWRHQSDAQRNGDGIPPPTYPCSIPVVGHLLSMAWDSPAFISAVRKQFKHAPVRLRLLVTDMYLISSTENINAVWKHRHMHNKAYKILAVQNIFNMPKATLAFWNADDSGVDRSPYPDSVVPPHLRIEYLTHSSVVKFLTGPSLKPFSDRFSRNLTDQLLKRRSTTSEWEYLPDLFSLMQHELLPAALKSMCGLYLLTINPTFVEDFWAFNRCLYVLAKGYPRLLFPAPYTVRDINACATILSRNRRTCSHNETLPIFSAQPDS